MPPSLSNTIRLWGFLRWRNVHVAAEDAQRKCAQLALIESKLLPQSWPWISWLVFTAAPSGSDRIITKQAAHTASFSPDADFKKHDRTLVSRGMPLNKHINREKQSTCHTLTNTRRDKNAESLLIEKNPAGGWVVLGGWGGRHHRHGCAM